MNAAWPKVNVSPEYLRINEAKRVTKKFDSEIGGFHWSDTEFVVSRLRNIVTIRWP
jgi:hypothetical protein